MTAGPVNQESGSHANLQHWLEFFCSSAVTKASLGVIKPLRSSLKNPATSARMDQLPIR